MRIEAYCVIAAIICSAPPVAAQPVRAALVANDPAGEVKALQFALEGFVATGDFTSFSQRVAPECKFITGNGEVFLRDRYIAHLRGMNGKMAIADDQMEVRVFDGSAILTAHQRVTLTADGVQTVRYSVLTRTFVLKNGGWLLASSQSTPTER